MAQIRPDSLRRALLAILPATLLALPGAAEAQTEELGLLLGLRGVGEVWQDAGLSRVYRSSRFGLTGHASYKAWRFLRADLELGYHRMAGDAVHESSGRTLEAAASFEMVPISLLVCATHRVGGMELYGGLGPALTAFSERSPAGSVSGTKIGPALQLGARIDTGLAQPSIRPDKRAQIQAVDLDIFVGRRQHQAFGVGTGLDLSAWRAGLGLAARF